MIKKIIQRDMNIGQIYPSDMECLFNLKGKIILYIKEKFDRDPPVISEDIQRESNIGSPTASEYLSTLEKKGFIRRVRNGRHKHIFPTEFTDYFF